MVDLDLVRELTKLQFKIEYRTTILGYFWIPIRPFIWTLILYVVFTHLKSKEEAFVFQLLLAVTMWHFFVEATNGGMNALVSHKKILENISIDTRNFVLAGVFSTTIPFIINFVIIQFLIIIFYKVPSFYYFQVLIINFVAEIVLVIGVSLCLAMLYTKKTDIRYIWQSICRVGFFLTPIIWNTTDFPSNIQKVLLLNPMVPLIENLKMSLLGIVPRYPIIIYVMVFMLLLVVMWKLFRDSMKFFVENLLTS